MDFSKEYWDEIVVIAVNLNRATFLESEDLKNIINEDISKGYKSFIIDLSRCGFVDPIFAGTLIMKLKELIAQSGNLKLVAPAFGSQADLPSGNNFRIFDIFSTAKDAMNSYKKIFVTPPPENVVFNGYSGLDSSFTNMN